MEYFAAIDVSQELSSVCVVDGTGKIVCEKKVASEPEALAAFFRGSGLILTRIGLEAGPLSQWLHAGLTAAGLPAILIETRHVKAALKAMTVKTDRIYLDETRPDHRDAPSARHPAAGDRRYSARLAVRADRAPHQRLHDLRRRRRLLHRGLVFSEKRA